MGFSCFSFLILTLLGGTVAVVAKEKAWKGWKCDEMTPNLCKDLIVSTGSFETHSSLKIHYWRYTSPNLDKKNKYPIVVVNGGPGMPHNYVLPWKQLACREREVIFYDQGGTGESALPPNTTVADDYPFLLDASYYANEELPALVKALSLKKYHIVSDSWGTQIAMMNAIESRDPNLLSLALNGPVPRATDYHDISWDPVEGAIGTLPNNIKKRMLAIEEAGDFESEEMQEITAAVLANFYSRNGLFADCVMESLEGINEEVDLGMWGPVDFLNMTGTLKDFDLWPDINNGALRDIPILLTSGQFDMVRPVTVDALHKQLSLSETILLPTSGHISIMDATEELLNAVDDFVGRVEFAEADEQIVFVPKQSAREKEESVPVATLQYAVAVVIVVVTFVIGMVVGQARGAAHTRAGYSEVA